MTAIVLLRSGDVQTFVAQKATVYLSEMTGSRIRLGRVSYDFADQLTVERIYVEDLDRDTLLYVDRLDLNFSPIDILFGQIKMSSIDLDGVYANLKTDSTGETNMQFLLDAFASTDTTPSAFDLLLEARRVNLTNARFHLTDTSRPEAAAGTTFNPACLRVEQLNASLSLNRLAADTLDAQIHSLMLRERSGLRVDNLKAHLVAGRSEARLEELLLRLPHSVLEMKPVVMTYDSLANLSHPERVRFDVGTRRLEVGLQDLAFLLPSLRGTSGTLEGKLHLGGSLNNLNGDLISLSYNGEELLRGTANFSGSSLQDGRFEANVDHLGASQAALQDLVSAFTGKPRVLPAEVRRLGSLRFKGSLNGQPGHVDAQGTLLTDLGSLKTNLRMLADSGYTNLKCLGSVSTPGFRLGRMLGVDGLGSVSFSARVDAANGPSEPTHGEVDGMIHSISYRGYDYRQIALNGLFDHKSFEGFVSSNDENLDFRFNGLINLAERLPVFNFHLYVNNADLGRLNLTESSLSAGFKADIDLVGNNLDNINGYADIREIRLDNGASSYHLQNLTATARTSDTLNSIIVKSDLLTAKVEGRYSNSTLTATLEKFVARYLPSLLSEKELRRINRLHTDNRLELYAYVSHTEQLCEVLSLPFRLNETATIKGRVDEPAGELDLRMSAPSFALGDLEFSTLSLSLNNANRQVNLRAYAEQAIEASPLTCLLNLAARHDSVYTSLSWNKSDSIINSGQLRANVALSHREGMPLIDVGILPSQIIVADSLWHMCPSHVIINPDTTVNVQDFLFASRQQYININGRASRQQTDSLLVNLQDIDLGYWLQFVDLGGIGFGGHATGKAYVYGVLGQPAFDANLLLRQAQINSVNIGDLQAMADWDREQKLIRINGYSTSRGDTVVYAAGTISTEQDSIDFRFRANGFNLGIINRYTENFGLNVQGFGYGNVHLYQYPSIDDIRITVEACAKDASLGLAFLGTRYYLSPDDTIRLLPTRMVFDSIHATDAEGHPLLVNGTVRHDGGFRTFSYDLSIDVDNDLVMNTTAADNDLYYGKIYASGRANIMGNDNETAIVVNARTMPGSKFNLSTASASTASDNSFITFITHEAPGSPKAQNVRPDDEMAAKLFVHLTLDVTPDALVQIVIDPKTGDMITGRGAGNIVFEYPNSDDVRLYGTYTIESGSYSFTFQNVLRREFKISRGSSLAWTGDPLNAQIDISAVYSTSASLADLDQTVASSVTRSTVPVNCILRLTDNLQSPTIGFDVELPNSEEALRQQVRNIINTEEMKSRQVLYLLVLNKFYTPDYMRLSTSNVAGNDAYSLLSSTLTGQINNWISKLTSDFSFGFNMHTSGEGETATEEYTTQFLYQPNNRLVINGNVGYRNDNLTQNKIIGDMDVEYLLTANGKLRAKAYTHTVDRYSLKTSQTEQGVGVVYREEFNSVGQFFNDLFSGKKSSKKKEKGESEKKKSVKSENQKQQQNP